MGAYFALAGLQLVGGFQQADIIRQNGDLSASINDMNAKYAELDAYRATEAGYSTAARYQTSVNQTIGEDRAALASENVDIKYGTAASIESDNRIAGLTNTLQIQKQAQDAAVGYETQAINLRLGGQMIQLQANLNAASAQSAGIMNAISTGIAGYAYGQSTGKGNNSRTGMDAKPGSNRGATASNVNLTQSGDGIRAPATDYGNGYSWNPDAPQAGNNGQPGFFGHGPRETYGYGGLGNYSFTSETGG